MPSLRLTAGVIAGSVALALPLSPPIVAADSSGWAPYRSAATNNANVASGVADVHTGTIATANKVRAMPVVAGGKLLVGNHGSGELQAFDLATGELSWQRKAPNRVHSEMIYRDGRVFVRFGNRCDKDSTVGDVRVRGTGESGILGFDAETGLQLWHTPIGAIEAAPVADARSVYFTTVERTVYALGPVSGAQQRTFDLDGKLAPGGPVIVDDTRLVLPRPSAHVYIVALEDDEERFDGGSNHLPGARGTPRPSLRPVDGS